MRRAVGYAVLIALLWIAALFALLFWPVRMAGGVLGAKETVRAIDQLVNAFWFGGLGRESLSSHAGREQIRPVVWLTDLVEPGHCAEANRREQPIVDVLNRGGKA